ncbi:ArsR/SmtB family transcription factor [Kocuria sp. M1R5S2]|uniref:ArsR/SmtB family transcription factor n=1 Tax=Kocuria rhizosphaerae TaxID=3376285 RepID=UPI00379AC924
MTPDGADLEAAARLFRALATPSRLRLLCLLGEGQATVSQLVERSGLSQPLVSQHLRILRETGLVTLTRSGREAVHALADTHVGHIVADAVAHAAEPRSASGEVRGAAPEQRSSA